MMEKWHYQAIIHMVAASLEKNYPSIKWRIFFLFLKGIFFLSENYFVPSTKNLA